MAYVFKKIPDITLDVPVEVPGMPKNAKPPTLKVKYRLLSVDEQKAVFEAPKGEQIHDDELMARDILDFPGGVTWQDVDDDGVTVGKAYQREFSQDFLAELMNISYMRTALVQGWLKAQAGMTASAEKNSRGLVGTLQA